jgi:hypothetical protein
MSKVRSPCTVCSMTIGICGLIAASSVLWAFVFAPLSFLVRAREITVQLVIVLRSVPHLRLSVPWIFAQELDGNSQALFPGAALVNARQLLCGRPAEELRRLETGQASHVLHCDELEAGLPLPGHASRRVGDGPSLPLTAAVIDTADRRPARGLIHD